MKHKRYLQGTMSASTTNLGEFPLCYVYPRDTNSPLWVIEKCLHQRKFKLQNLQCTNTLADKTPKFNSLFHFLFGFHFVIHDYKRCLVLHGFSKDKGEQCLSGSGFSNIHLPLLQRLPKTRDFNSSC